MQQNKHPIAIVNDKNASIGNIFIGVMKLAFNFVNLRGFLLGITRIAQKETNAKACMIFFLDENKKFLRIKAGSGKNAEILEGLNAAYYIPARDAFNEAVSGQKVIEAWKKHSKLKELPDVEQQENARLIEAGKLPMGITA